MINYSLKPKFYLEGQLLNYYELICISKQQLFLLTNTSLFLNDAYDMLKIDQIKEYKDLNVIYLDITNYSLRF